jgi:hypothetical protein
MAVMGARASSVSTRVVRNGRGETIEVGFVVTVIDGEHIYGTGHVERIEGQMAAPWFAKVVWDDGQGYDWLEVDELTNVNVGIRERTLNGP